MIYEDYFKSIIGGSSESPEYYNSTYEPIQVNSFPNYDYIFNKDVMTENKVMDLYPDIYKVISPMIDKMILAKQIKDLNENTINSWTLEIYDALEVDENNNKNIGLNNQNSNMKQNNVYESETTNARAVNKNINLVNNKTNSLVNNNVKQVNKEVSKTDILNNSVMEVNTRYRNKNNPILRDLIKIMILNKLFGNNNANMPRPPRPYRYQNFSNNMELPMQNYKPVNTNPYSQYLKKEKTYFDTPYPEEG